MSCPGAGEACPLSLDQFVTTFEEIIHSCSQHEPGAEGDAFMQTQEDRLCDMFKQVSSLSDQATNEILCRIGDSPFKGAARKRLVTACLQCRKRCKDSVEQTHLYSHNYLSQRQWDTLLNKQLPDEIKLYVFEEAFLSWGLVYPSPDTLVHAISILEVAKSVGVEGPEASLQANPHQAITYTESSKQI